MKEAVLAIEDRRFYYHPGIDPIRMVGAVFTNLFGNRPYLVGGSTITQQLARNFFLTEQMQLEQQTRQRSYRRKMLEQFMSVILETKATKDEILELYLNDVYLGNRGSFALHGVAEASKIYFGKDVTNLTLVGSGADRRHHSVAVQSLAVQQPRSRQANAAMWCLRAMADAGYITGDAADRAQKEPIAVVARAVDNEAPYFIDYFGGRARHHVSWRRSKPGALDIYTTLDLNLQRNAQDAVRDGIASVDTILSRRKREAEARRAGGARRDRSTDRRDPRFHRRPLLQPVAVQPRRRGAAADGLHLQAVRLSRGVRKGRRRWHGRPHAGHDCLRRADDVELRQPGMVAEELRRRVRRRDHAAPRARDVAQRRRRSRWPNRPATTVSWRCGRRPRSAIPIK